MKIFHNEINLRLFLFQIKVTCDVNLILARVRVRVRRTGQRCTPWTPWATATRSIGRRSPRPTSTTMTTTRGTRLYVHR